MIRASRPDWHGHLLLIHHTEQERRAGVATWVRCGLELGEKVLYIEPAAQPAARSLLNVLAEQQVVLDGATARGQLQILRADHDLYTTDGLVDQIDDALAQGYRGVRLSAEAPTARELLSGRAHQDLEWATDLLCRTRPVSILCQYSADLARKALPEVSAMHGDGVRETLLQTARLPGGIIVRGEVDVSNHDVLHWALQAATLGAADSFVVDLSQLEFLDVSGARALLEATKSYRHSGGRVRLRKPQHLVHRVLELCRVDEAGGLMVDQS